MSSVNRRSDYEDPRDEQLMTYVPLGSRNAQRTENAYNVALNQFDTFLSSKGVRTPFMELNEEYLCDLTLFGEFATFLVDFATERNNGINKIMRDTALQYISGVKTSIKRRFPNSAIWRDESWYTKLRAEMETTYDRYSILSGLPLTEKSDPIYRDSMLSIGEHYIQVGSSQAMEKRAIICLTYAAVGRSGEAAKTRIDSLDFDTSMECITLDWNELKTVNSVKMPLFADKYSPEMCVYHSLASYFICCSSNDPWLFPNFENVKTPAASITRWFKDLIKEKVIPNKIYNGTSLRIGSVNEIVNNRNCELIHGIARGGWSVESINTIFEYLICSMKTIAVGGRCLAGWSNPRAGARSPRLIVNLSEQDKIKVNNLIGSLFHVNARDELLPILEIFLATLLMHFPYTMRRYGSNNPINSKLIFLASKYGIDREKLIEWGIAIKRDFVNKNEADETGVRSDESVINQVLALLRIMQSEYKEQKDIIQSLERRIDEISQKTAGPIASCTPSNRKGVQIEDDDGPTSEASGNTGEINAIPKPNNPKNALQMMMSSGGVSYELKALSGIELKTLLADSIIYDFKGKPSFTSDKRIKEKVQLVLDFLMDYAENDEKVTLSQKKPDRDDPAWAKYESDIYTTAQTVAGRAFSKLAEFDGKNGKAYVSAVVERVRTLRKEQTSASPKKNAKTAKKPTKKSK
jgi:hypothetical protein